LSKKFLVNALAASSPSSNEATATPKHTSRKLIAGIVIAVIAIAVVATVLIGLNTFGTFSNVTQDEGSSQSQTNVQEASSLKFSLSSTQDSTQLYAFTVQGKNIGTQDMMLRIEGTLPGIDQDVIYIINGVQKKAWMYANNQWIDLSSEYTDQWNRWDSIWSGYVADLDNWSGIGDYSYTDPSTGDTLRIYDIQVNPQIPDSVFTP
jgi:hypothetical protein